MKIKDYKLFLESKETIDSICQKYGIENYTINDDGTVDVNGNVDFANLTNGLYGKHLLSKLPLKFGKVTGYFNCGHNKLNSLEGSPNYVGGYFACNNNDLITLEYGPKVVIGDYYCKNNYLINFKGFPEDYEGEIWFNDNPIFEVLIKIPGEKRNKFIYWCRFSCCHNITF